MERARAYSNALEKTQETFLKGRWLQSVMGNEDLVCTLNMDKRAVARMAYLLVDKKIRHSKAYWAESENLVVCFTMHILQSVLGACSLRRTVNPLP